MARLTDEQAELFREPNLGVMATIRADGTPHLSTVWVDYDGEDVLVNTAQGRAKAENLQRDPRATVWVGDRTDPYRWVAVTGHADVDDEEEADVVAHIDKLSEKYTGRDKYDLPEGQHRLIVRVRPERVVGQT